MAEQHHAAGITYAQNINAKPIRDDRVFIVVNGELDDGLFVFLFRHQHRNRHFLAWFWCGCCGGVGHLCSFRNRLWDVLREQ